MDEDDGWDSYADGWDQDEAARAYAKAAFASLQDVVDGSDVRLERAKVIDFGCGTGLLTERLVPLVATIDAVDTSAAMLAVLDEKIARNDWTTVSTGTEPPTTAPYDLIVCSSVCSFLEDYPGTVVALASLLGPGGLFVQWDWERFDGDDHGLGRGEIVDALTRAGLDRVAVATAFDVAVGDQAMRPLIGHGRRPETGSEVS